MNIKKGQLLISEPTLSESFFFKSVILILHHDNNESLGLILNQGTKIKLNELLNDIPPMDLPVYIGGPVERKSIQFIHTLGEIVPNTQKITKELYWGGDFNIIIKLMAENKISKKNIRFFAGYSGWGEDQLNNEIKEDSWLLHEANTKICMQYSSYELWSKLIKTKQTKYAIWTNMPIDPSLN